MVRNFIFSGLLVAQQDAVAHEKHARKGEDENLFEPVILLVQARLGRSASQHTCMDLRLQWGS